ncbi:(Fe-S)-binding protein [Methylomarinum vadi]|uniref:(Fe-S)-binding protein n=1 Tax=Methylomarinum vadi TaxID=438855 RepID=UPI0004DF6060|nr:(Fe-S)-binding protein [Methylomarinum vadi]
MFDMMDFDGGSMGEINEPCGPIVPEPMDCMRCGLCLRSCPTYQISGDEQEGPRQRIRTLGRLLLEKQPVTSEALRHLQNCVQCRTCEAVCPSRMNYAELFEQAQSQCQAMRIRSVWAALALYLVARPNGMKALIPLLWFYQASGLGWLLRKLKLLKFIGLEHADRLAPHPVLQGLKPFYPAADAKGTVALFSGCISDRFDRATLLAAIQVLNQIGYSVVVPGRQNCCGAIHLHNGDRDTAERLLRHNIEVFSALPVDAVIYCATGCGSQMRDYSRLVADDQGVAAAFNDKLFEICDFVERHWPERLTLQPSDASVLVHEPCTQRNVLQNPQAVYKLLQRIPCLNVKELQDNHLCCGAGGSYMLTHPDNAEKIREQKLGHIESRADMLVTTNIGCALHLNGVSNREKQLAVVHPIRLIADRM